MRKKLKKQIKFSKYYSLFLKKNLFFICILDDYKKFSNLRQELVLNNFIIKFLKNKFLKNLPHFFNVIHFITGPVFCIYKTSLFYNDYLILKELLFKQNYVILFYFDNRYYSGLKINCFKNILKSQILKVSCFSYFYFLVKLGFILKLEKFNQFLLKK